MNKKKINAVIAMAGSVVILTIGGLVLNQMHNNYLANQITIEKCFEDFDEVKEVVVKKDGYWSPVSCETVE